MIVWPESVVDSIARRRAVVVIGSGVSANAIAANGARPPTWGAFLRAAYSELGKRIAHIKSAMDEYNYLEVCDYLKAEFGSEWGAIIDKYFVAPKFRPAEIHKAIFELDSRIVVSLNFDKIYDTYALKASDNTVIIKSYDDDNIRQAVAGSGRYIIKPHGSVDSLSRMIFTLEDYAKARVSSAPFYEMMSSLLHTHTFLFVGCGLSDPDMKIIFEDYRYKFAESPHYIVMPLPIATQRRDLIRRTRGLNVLAYAARDDHVELTDSLKDLVSTVALKRELIASDQNW